MLYKGFKLLSIEVLLNRFLKFSDVCDGVWLCLNENFGDGRDGLGDILCCSVEKVIDNSYCRFGVDEVCWVVMRVCGLESDELGEKKIINL